MSSRQCLLELQREAVFLWTSELENVATLCFRAFEGSNYNVRVSVANLLGTLLAAAVEPRQPTGTIREEEADGGEEKLLRTVLAGNTINVFKLYSRL